MRRHSLCKTQRGLSLVTVLLLTTGCAILVFGALNASMTQSRLSGNFQKKLNAQLQAEQSAIEQFHALNQALKDNPTADMQALAATLQQQQHSDSDGRARQAQIDASSLTATDLRMLTLGLRFSDSRSSQQVLYSLRGSNGTPALPYKHALIGCDGVTMSGSGRIIGFDSENSSAQNIDLSVHTVRPGGSVTLTGSAPIEGDVLSRGNISVKGSALIKGRVHANGNILLDNASARIQREVWAGGQLQITNTVTVDGEVRANQGISISNGASLNGGLFSRQGLTLTGGPRVSGQTAVLGDIRLPAWVANGNYFSNKTAVSYSGSTQHNFGQHQPQLTVQAVQLLPEDNSLDENQQHRKLCDPIDLSSQVGQLTVPAGLQPLNVRASWEQRRYQFSTSEGQYLDKPQTDRRSSPVSSSFAGRNRQIYFLERLTLDSDAVLTIDGAVTLYLQQGLTMAGAAQLVIKPGASLTIISAGKVTLAAGAKVLTSENGNEAPQGLVQGQPVLSIYSTYQSQHVTDYGIDLQGAASGLYAGIYAPNAHVNITASNGFAGAVVAKTIGISGAGNIRYDQALGRLQAGQGGTAASAKRVVLAGL